MNSIIQYFSEAFKGIQSLLTGMYITIKEFFTPKVTEMYPENRATLKISERFKGDLTMPCDENFNHKCTACNICAINCPNNSIIVESEKIETEEGKSKKVLTRYIWDQGKCTFCNICVITCPSDAIIFTNTFENSVFNKAKLTKQLNDYSNLKK